MIIAEAVRRFEETEAAFTDIRNGQSFEPIVDFEAQVTEELVEGGPHFGEFHKASQCDFAVRLYGGSHIENYKPRIVAHFAAEELDVLPEAIGPALQVWLDLAGDTLQ